MVTLTSAENALKTLYLGVVADQLNTNVNPLLAKISQTENDVWGKEIRKLAPFGINGGIGAGTEDGTLPAAASNNYAQFVLTLKNLYGTIEISDKAIRASQNSSGAFVNLLEAEMEGLVKASKFNFGRMLFGDGSGVLATVSDQTGNSVGVDSVKNLMEGMVVDVISAATKTVVASGLRIVDVDRASKKITLSGNIGAASVNAGDYLTVQGSYGNELTGLKAIFGDSSTLYGLSRASNKWLAPYKATASTLTDTVIQKAIDTLDEVAGSTADFIVCSGGVKRAYQEYLVTNRTNIDVMNLTGGYKAISYNGIPVVSDRFAPEGTMYVLNTADFHLHQLCDWRWLEDNEGRVIKQVANKPVYTATLVKYADMICDRPIGQAMISGITEA
ncbi:MAG: phage major capsid protein [Corallococcus sp.]|nr:phage major capsid protein [Corallococcus sp.]MCM1359662.1 phage major capsid protein [Corallococcus sp.]MCM1395371.1 phage major capsid protein [Corallococcus sp.]